MKTIPKFDYAGSGPFFTISKLGKNGTENLIYASKPSPLSNKQQNILFDNIMLKVKGDILITFKRETPVYKYYF